MAELNPILKELRKPTIKYYIRQGNYVPKWKRILAVILIRFVVLAIGPFVSIIDLAINLFNRTKKATIE